MAVLRTERALNSSSTSLAGDIYRRRIKKNSNNNNKNEDLETNWIMNRWFAIEYWLNEKMGTRLADGYMTRSAGPPSTVLYILNNANDFINTYAQRLEDDY